MATIEESIMSIDEARFRQALGHFASGVTVITTAHKGRLYGMTVSSFASLSLRPPLVLICINNGVSSHDAIIQSGGFAVNILQQNQEHLSRRFASSEVDKYTGVAWRSSNLGFPLLEGALASLECRLYETLPGGDHTIIIGEVVDSAIAEGEPLLYYRGGYRELQ